MVIRLERLDVSINFERGIIEDLIIDGKSRLVKESELFAVGLRNRKGERSVCQASCLSSVRLIEKGAVYTFLNFFSIPTLEVEVKFENRGCDCAFSINAQLDASDVVIEWVDFAKIILPLLEANVQGGGKVLWPFNEGVLVNDIYEKDGAFPPVEPEYPSQGSYAVFPNMISSQMMAYLWKDAGLYVGVHDKSRGVKCFDFFPNGEGVEFRVRLFSEVNYGERFETDYQVVWSVCEGRWESAAEKYRSWFEADLPSRLVKIKDNASVPSWYEDAPLVVSYPVQGRYDSDQMSPNRYIPYVNALETLDEIQKQTESKLLVLLMHWEGTAPWAPPYVWPPVGGEQMLDEFKRELHKRGNLLGLYCSGFGYTLKSNLVKSYDKTDEYERDDLKRGMCTGINGDIRGVICTIQRKGCDICPASSVGRNVIEKAYAPLFSAGIDYLQILDQNHGGGQYLCYEESHGHPTAPGRWMTENMQELLKTWNTYAPKTVFGCESAASEPFISSLLFNDNRFELNLKAGKPVPLYQFVYHEYVRNFMGNQVGCPFKQHEDTLRYRIAYSFVAGDSMTIVVDPDGRIMAHWGREYYENKTDGEKVLRFIRNLTRFYKEKAKPYLYRGRMVCGDEIESERVSFERRDKDGYISIPQLYYSHWQGDSGKIVTIVANPTENDTVVLIDQAEYIVPTLDAILV